MGVDMEIISYSKMTAEEREAYALERVRQQKENEKRSKRKRCCNTNAVFAGSKIGTGVEYFDTKVLFDNPTRIF